MMQTDDVRRLRFRLVAAEFLQRMGERIRERRKALGLSRADVARKMPGKVSENQVYRWELGQHQPKPDTLEALAKVLECDVVYFMAPELDKRRPPDLHALSGESSQLDHIEQTLNHLEEQIRLLRVETAARDVEVLKRLDEGLPPTPQTQQPPPP